jgi:hypothetical protein
VGLKRAKSSNVMATVGQIMWNYSGGTASDQHFLGGRAENSHPPSGISTAAVSKTSTQPTPYALLGEAPSILRVVGQFTRPQHGD